MAFLMKSSPVPVLCAGDHLTRDEFERRYAAMPDLKKAELIEGVVYMASAVRYEQHAHPEHLLSAWLVFYEALTMGLGSAGNCSVRLDLDNLPQPDLLLRIPERAGGSSRVAADGYLEGPPELIVEVAASSTSYDLHQKLHAYRRNGVAEYIVLRVEDGELDWFLLEGGIYVRQEPDAGGMLGSRTFPGLRLDLPALLRGDLRALRLAVEQACGGPAHAAFAARVAPLP
jgi:Uma2 family endonuclease